MVGERAVSRKSTVTHITNIRLLFGMDPSVVTKLSWCFEFLGAKVTS